MKARRTTSLGRRLLSGAILFIVAALIVAGLIIGVVLQRFLVVQIDQRLDAQVLTVAAALDVTDDEKVRLPRNVDVPPFDRAFSGWYWQVFGAGEPVRSRSLSGSDLAIPETPREPIPVSVEGADARGEPLHMRVRRITLPGAPSPLVIVAAAPAAAIRGPLSQAALTLAVGLGLLGLALVGAVLLQVRSGLRPLRRLRSALVEVRAGRLHRIPSDQPDEVSPLVDELNGLLDQNAENLARARMHVANLAHGLKTPLATLTTVLAADPTRDPDAQLGGLVTLMDKRIRHHLRRARVAAPSGPARVRTPLRPHVDDLVTAMSKIHADKAITVEVDMPLNAMVACEPQDLDEMLGNLLDNAFKWAEGRVRVSASDTADRVGTVIEDDGASLADEQIAALVEPGRRLDEAMPGHGFGLVITRELADLYGGDVRFGRSPLGGLAVTLTLPGQTRS